MIYIKQDQLLTLDALREVPVVTPANAKGYWRGVPHHKFVETILNKCRERGWKTDSLRVMTARGGDDMVGAIHVYFERFGYTKTGGYEVVHQLGFLTSNAGRYASRLYAGASIKSQDMHTPFVTTEVSLGKHTKDFDLAANIDIALDDYYQAAPYLTMAINQLKEIKIDDAQANSLLIEIAQKELMPWSRIGAVGDSYNNPFLNGAKRGSGWGFMTAFACVGIRNPPFTQMTALNEMREILTKEGGRC